VDQRTFTLAFLPIPGRLSLLQAHLRDGRVTHLSRNACRPSQAMPWALQGKLVFDGNVICARPRRSRPGCSLKRYSGAWLNHWAASLSFHSSRRRLSVSIRSGGTLLFKNEKYSRRTSSSARHRVLRLIIVNPTVRCHRKVSPVFSLDRNARFYPAAYHCPAPLAQHVCGSEHDTRDKRKHAGKQHDIDDDSNHHSPP
jgi:hypothetical protein